jgi:hypothetical protein
MSVHSSINASVSMCLAVYLSYCLSFCQSVFLCISSSNVAYFVSYLYICLSFSLFLSVCLSCTCLSGCLGRPIILLSCCPRSQGNSNSCHLPWHAWIYYICGYYSKWQMCFKSRKTRLTMLSKTRHLLKSTFRDRNNLGFVHNKKH